MLWVMWLMDREQQAYLVGNLRMLGVIRLHVLIGKKVFVRDVTNLFAADSRLVAEEQLHNVAQIAASTHSNSYGDVVSTSGTNLPKIDIPSCGGIFRQDELSTKKSGLSALQQLPSPLASEDETHDPKVVMHWHSCTKKSQPPSKPANDGILRLQQKPFYPKSFPSKSSRQLLHESLVRRDRQQERKTNRSNTTLPVHERIVSSQQSEKYQTTQGSISRPAMGVSQSRLAQKATPLPVMRRLDRVSNRVSKPASTKNGWIQAVGFRQQYLLDCWLTGLDRLNEQKPLVQHRMNICVLCYVSCKSTQKGDFWTGKKTKLEDVE